MDFRDLYKKIAEIDSQVDEMGCGSPQTPLPAVPPKPETPPPSMSVNLNAHGIDDIESMLRIIAKVNPDMPPRTDAPAPTPMPMPSIKMLPSDGPLEKEAWDNEPDEEYDDISASIPSGDDLHKQKKGYPAAAGGDNPRAIESQELRNKIKESLQAQLEKFKNS